MSHRDIKPENIMFESASSNTVKLLDFGLSAFVPTGGNNNYNRMQSAVGTAWYIAPEVIRMSYT